MDKRVYRAAGLKLSSQTGRVVRGGVERRRDGELCCAVLCCGLEEREDMVESADRWQGGEEAWGEALVPSREARHGERRDVSAGKTAPSPV